MQREEAYPSGRVDRILMRVIPRLGDVVGNVVNGNDPVGERQEDEHNDYQREETQEVHKRVRLAMETKALHQKYLAPSLSGQSTVLLVEREVPELFPEGATPSSTSEGDTRSRFSQDLCRCRTLTQWEERSFEITDWQSGYRHRKDRTP